MKTFTLTLAAKNVSTTYRATPEEIQAAIESLKGNFPEVITLGYTPSNVKSILGTWKSKPYHPTVTITVTAPTAKLALWKAKRTVTRAMLTTKFDVDSILFNAVAWRFRLVGLRDADHES
ncbi:hypothetical protein [Vibrio phage vB_ValS_PJ32]|nr:hypothetical protein [Vibrio phage vB_ValS_PJ32]